MNNSRVSSGFSSLDQVIDNLRLGDNVVWQVNNIDDYRYFANFLVKEALTHNKRLVYLRFGQHAAILPSTAELPNNQFYQEYKLDAGLGFEAFSSAIQDIITREGEGVYYVFDCLSELLSDWSTDLMIGNFFLVTCPYLFQLNTIAYFAILRDHHSYQTIARIRNTTQLLLDLFHQEHLCVHPLKVWQRYSPTMFLPHILINDGKDFVPLTSSADVTHLFSKQQYKLSNIKRQLDYWDHIFLNATEVAEKAKEGDLVAAHQETQVLEELLRMVIGRDEKILNLAQKYLTIQDLLQIKTRLIGSGFIGGKAVGLLLSRAILANDPNDDWLKVLEPHDSFFIGSDVYYTYLIENDCWQLRLEQKKPENYFSAAALLKEKMMQGHFPDDIRDQFLEMLEYFGQAPIIVRSSSLLEDSFGNIFAGKYESVFCANQGNLAERYEMFIQAVRDVYSSTMNEDALAYRLQRGLAQNDEQMALLIQRVSGVHRRSFFFPDLAGVALSHNLYIWRPDMDPTAGMLRLVIGLGTRAVNRVGDDYARFIALDQPTLRTEATLDEQMTYSQHGADVLNLEKNTLLTMSLQDIIKQNLIPQLTLFAAKDISFNIDSNQWVLNFENLLQQTDFPKTMRKMLQTLQTAYGYPVDTEFTCNFFSKTNFLVNLLQCRPIQVKTNQKRIRMPKSITASQTIFATQGKAMGGNLELKIKRLVYVIPENYAALNQSDKYQIARLIGKLNQLIISQDESPTILLGPGRWGTSTPSLGIPVSFAEINKFTAVGEIAFKTSGFMPELSYGTHFFQNMIESSIFYLIINEQDPGTVFNHEFLKTPQNQLTVLLPSATPWNEVVFVIDERTLNEEIWLHTDIWTQNVLCWKRSK